MRYAIKQNAKISSEMSAAVIPFAQREMVHSFMEGVSPNYQQTIEEYLRSLFTDYPKEIIKQISGLDKKAQTALLKKMDTATQGLVEQFITEVQKWSRVNNVFLFWEL